MAKDYAFWLERLKATEKELEKARRPLTWLGHLPESPADLVKGKKSIEKWQKVRNRWVSQSRARAHTLREVAKLEKRLTYIREQMEIRKPESVWLRLLKPMV